MSPTPVSAAESGFVPVISRQAQSRQGPNPTTISNAIRPLLQWRRDDFPLAATTSLLLEVSAASLKEWIPVERLRVLPSQGSNYDNVLAWTWVLVERLHALEKVVDSFVPDIYLASDLACGYCAMLLELGEENAMALMVSFGFFHDISAPLENILRATSADSSEEIIEQITLTVVDLVALIAAVSIHYYKAIMGVLQSFSMNSMNIREQFAGQIGVLRVRYERATVAISRHRLRGAIQDPEGGDNLNAIQSWLAPDDPVVAALNENVSSHAMEREEGTCRWIQPYVRKWQMIQSTHIHLTGRAGSGRSVLTQAILNWLHLRSDRATRLTLSVSISSRIPAERTTRSIARGILHQMFTQSVGNIPLLLQLSESFEHSQRMADDNDYDDLLWDTLKLALKCLAPDFDHIFLVVDGVDEALCDEQSLLRKLVFIIPESTNVKLITLGTHKPPAADGQTLLEVTRDLTFDDVYIVVQNSLECEESFRKLPETEKEAIIDNLTKAAEGSFLWAKLASNYARGQENSDQRREAINILLSIKPSVSDFIHLTLNKEDVSIEAKHMLVMLAIAQRPLRPVELHTLASILIDKQIVPVSDTEFEDSLYRNLRPVNVLIKLSGGLFSYRHGLIKDAVLNLLSSSQVNHGEDPATDFVTRLFVYLKCAIGESSEPALTALDEHTATSLQHDQPLLPYALRYWPAHFQSLSAAPQNPNFGSGEQFAPVLPTSTTCIRLLSTVWAALPLPECVRYHELTTDLYRTAVGPNHVATLQCMVLLAGLYDRLGHVDRAIRLYYEAAMSSRTSLTARHPFTLQLVGIFLELTTGQITNSRTEFMRWRGECIVLCVECHELQHGETSDEAVTARRLLAEHHQTLGEPAPGAGGPGPRSRI